MAQAYSFMSNAAKPTNNAYSNARMQGQQAQQAVTNQQAMNKVTPGTVAPSQVPQYQNSPAKPAVTPAPVYNGGQTFTPTPNPYGGAMPGAWKPTFSADSQLQNPGQPLQSSPLPNLMGPGYEGLWKPGVLGVKDSQEGRFIDNNIPLRSQMQNEYQYGTDFNEAQRRWDTEMRQRKQTEGFDMQHMTRQQQMAEWEAGVAKDQWDTEFGHTKGMDLRYAGQKDTELANTFRQGMDQNQAQREVAGTYAGAQRYGADQQRMADYYQAQQAASADRYGADQTLAGAGLYAGAQRYGADVSGRADMYGADRGVDVANVYGGAQRYGSDQQTLQNKYQWDMQNRINQAQMANNLQVANTQAYGRSQAPAANWASNWA